MCKGASGTLPASFAVLFMDLDKFKPLNDRWGHATGDRVIQVMARLLCDTIRQQDHGGRLGGEEFAAILPETDLAGAQTLAERVRVLAASCVRALNDGDAPVSFTVSIGVAMLDANDEGLESLLQRADRALYQAKADGRNRVAVMAAEASSTAHSGTP